MSAIVNTPKSMPVTIKPTLKIGATGEIPKSLSALYVQLNQGERIIATLIEVMAKIGVIIPNQTAILG
jgi:hypothetical protein